MTVKAYTFDRAKISASDSAKINRSLFFYKSAVVEGLGNEMKLSSSGLNITIGTGVALIYGRYVEISAAEVLTIPPNYTGYLTIRIDLSKVNTSTGTPGMADYLPVINQVEVGFQTTLATDDISAANSTGVYDFVLATVASGASEVTQLTKKLVNYRGVFYNDDLGLHIVPNDSVPLVADSSLLTNTIESINGKPLNLKGGQGMNLTTTRGSVNVKSNDSTIGGYMNIGYPTELVGTLKSSLRSTTADVLLDAATDVNINAKGKISFNALVQSTVSVDGVNYVGTATSATKLYKPRTIQLSGAVSGNTTFDGTDNAYINTTIPHVTFGDSAIKFDKSITTSSTTSNGVNFDGVAASAKCWTTSRTLQASGDATGSVIVKGDSDMTLPLTLADVTRDDIVRDRTYLIGFNSSLPFLSKIISDSKGRITSAESEFFKLQDGTKQMNRSLPSKVSYKVVTSFANVSSVGTFNVDAFILDNYTEFGKDANGLEVWTKKRTYTGLSVNLVNVVTKVDLAANSSMSLGSSVNIQLPAGYSIANMAITVDDRYFAATGVVDATGSLDVKIVNGPNVLPAGSKITGSVYIALDPALTSSIVSSDEQI